MIAGTAIRLPPVFPGRTSTSCSATGIRRRCGPQQPVAQVDFYVSDRLIIRKDARGAGPHGPAPLAINPRSPNLRQETFSRRRSIRARPPVTRARTEPIPAGSISGTEASLVN